MLKDKKVKLLSGVLVATLAISTLSGCNYKMVDFEYDFDTAIIINDGVATIIDIKNWTDYDGEQIQIITKDGTILVTSSFDTKLMNSKEGEVSPEDFAWHLVGENGEVNYYNEQYSKVKK